MAIQLPLPTQQLADFCRRNAIRKLALFGSVLREDFRADSDVDVLVEFAPTAKVNFFTFVDMQERLQQILNREVDLHTVQSLSPHMLPKVLADAEVVYEQ